MKLPLVERVEITDSTLSVDLSDGRSISVPLAWFPRLMHASPKEQADWKLVGGGEGIHWGVDEGISVEGLLAGRPSAETQEALGRWLKTRSEASTN